MPVLSADQIIQTLVERGLLDEPVPLHMLKVTETWAGGWVVEVYHRRGPLASVTTPPLDMFYPDIIYRYLDLLHSCPPFGEDECGSEHLKVMLGQILYTDEASMSHTKKHRWLGFIQGVLITLKLTTVDLERDFTREFFNGA
jgi:hypothetical protein